MVANKRKNSRKSDHKTKWIVKFLSICRDPRVQSQIIRGSPKSVIKSVANAASNLKQINIPKSSKIFKKNNRNLIQVLADTRTSIPKKEQTLQKKISQSGGGLFLPLLLSTILPVLGSAFLSQEN